MLILLVLLTIVVFSLLSLWLTIFYFYTDTSVPTKSTFAYRNVVIVFPHPDDECLTVSGLAQRLKKQGVTVTLVLLTLGEKGTPNAAFKDGLKQVRTLEAKKSATVLGISQLILKDFGDGELSNKQALLKKYLTEQFKKTNPDLVITFDPTGVYGHPDHITCSDVVTKVVMTEPSLRKCALWYHALPEKVLAKINLPEHMAKDSAFKKRRVYPSFKVSTFWGTAGRVASLYAHQSQLHAFTSSVPVKNIPLWLYISAMQFEYFFQRK